MILSICPGFVFGRVYRACEHELRGTIPEHHAGHKFPGVSVEEELAECQGTLYQEYHGTLREDILK